MKYFLKKRDWGWGGCIILKHIRKLKIEIELYQRESVCIYTNNMYIRPVRITIFHKKMLFRGRYFTSCINKIYFLMHIIMRMIELNFIRSRIFLYITS